MRTPSMAKGINSYQRKSAEHTGRRRSTPMRLLCVL